MSPFGRSLWYDMDGKTIGIEEADALLRDITRRQLARTQVVTPLGTIEVSTVFLVLDHNHFGEGAPVLWETMVFGGPLDARLWRFASREQAEQGHADAVVWVRSELDLKRVAVLADETVGLLVAEAEGVGRVD